MNRQAYSTDLSDAEWHALEPYIPTAAWTGRPCLHSWREILNAIFSIMRSGCAWRLLPHDLPPWKTVYHYFRVWRLDGTWEPRCRVPPGWILMANPRSGLRCTFSGHFWCIASVVCVLSRSVKPPLPISEEWQHPCEVEYGRSEGRALTGSSPLVSGRRSPAANAMCWSIRRDSCWPSRSIPQISWIVMV
jgi:transposase